MRNQTEHVTGIWANLDLEEDLSARTQLLYGAEVVSNDVGSEGVRVDQESGAV
ncbi:MAG: hypothetical protein KDC02_06645, partial [Flavobacteriales bacterium]|nr:hypothetical protein [Flavobacteriales bacterium]